MYCTLLHLIAITADSIAPCFGRGPQNTGGGEKEEGKIGGLMMLVVAYLRGQASAAAGGNCDRFL
jgi:hypothetical protein